ncbi:MAG: DUF512 domain-containing protein [Halanaerobiaceae bacterium]
MDSRVKYMLLKTVQDKSILPVTSVCNMACQFCSHRNNSPGLDIYNLGHLELDLIEELLEYLPDSSPIIIGESATRIIEGDPMTHPRFMDILKIIRSDYPGREIRITTNGSYLDEEMVDFLDKNKPIELNISVNCPDPDNRVFLMADKNPEQVFIGLSLLDRHQIKFNGSIVAMPHLTGWSALEESINILLNHHPKTVRVFMPGYTINSDQKLKFDKIEMYKRLSELIKSFSSNPIPVLLEPPEIKDFHCLVKGIIPGTPAANSNLQKGDIISTVNGEDVLTRVDGFNKILISTDPQLEFMRDKRLLKTTIKKINSESSGIIVDYDMDIEMLDRLSGLLLNKEYNRMAVITSVLGKGIMESFMKYFYQKYQYLINDRQIDLIVSKNNYFGGSIMSAGLLTNNDIIKSLKNNGKKYEIIILPGIIYDTFGNDLTGKSYKQIEKELNTEIKIIK